MLTSTSSALSTPLRAGGRTPPHSGAATITPEKRKELAVRALARAEPIAGIAEQADVSRKYVYRQAGVAQRALDRAFQPPPASDSEVLFWLPVTRNLILVVVLVLVLRCHSSYRGVMDFLRDVFDWHMSIGTVHNIVSEATSKARALNRQEDLSPIRVGTLDEIFQGDPVLVGVEPKSTYCFLLAQESSRDATTWGGHLLDLEARGLSVDHTIADAGKGLRAGQALAWPGKPCRGDVFHAERDAGMMTTYLENRALGSIGVREKLERKMARAKQRGKGQSLSKDLAMARQREAEALQLADDMRVLVGWLRDDVLAFNGPDAPSRRELFDFIVAEMKAREHLATHRIVPVRKALENQRDDLLAFAEAIDAALLGIAARHQVPVEYVREVFELERRPAESAQHWKEDARLRTRLGRQHFAIKHEIEALKDDIVRASSLVENLNSRLRSYFFLRRQAGPDYLDLLRFFLNHHRLPRSRKEARHGKSPAEVLCGKTLPHWLEQLGFTLFRRPPVEQAAFAND